MDFPYHRAIAPMMWVLLALASLELLVVHLLVSLWSQWVAGVLSLLTLATIGWLVNAILSFRRLPVRIEGDRLILRVGTLRYVETALSNVRVDAGWDSAALKDRSVLNMALIAYPNILLRLTEPVSVRHRIVRAVAHRLDDPAAFLTALRTASPSAA